MEDYEIHLTIAERLLRRFKSADEIPSVVVMKELDVAFPDASYPALVEHSSDVFTMAHELEKDEIMEEGLEDFTTLFYDSEND